MPSFGESAARLLLEIDTDASSSKREITELRALIATETEKINRESYVSTIQQNSAVESLQRQRSSNLIRLWNDENNSVVSLQKQRSAALISENRNIEKTLLNDLKVLKVSGSYTDDLIKQNERAIANFGTVAAGVEKGVARTEARLATAKTGAASFTSTITSSIGPLTIAAGAIAAVGAAAIGAGVLILRLATDAAETGDKLYDLSQKVNVSAHDLSVWQIAAEQSGGSIDGVATSLGIFAKNMEAAHKPTSAQAALFKALKIDTDNINKALAQSVEVLFRMAPGEQQTALAMQLFGKSGKDMLGVIKQMNGDLPTFTALMDKAGATISDKDAYAANEFTDSMKLLSTQFEIAKFKVGIELLPVLQKLFTDLSGWISVNKGQFTAWGQSIADVIPPVVEFASKVATAVGWLRQFHELLRANPGEDTGSAIDTIGYYAGGGKYTQGYREQIAHKINTAIGYDDGVLDGEVTNPQKGGYYGGDEEYAIPGGIGSNQSTPRINIPKTGGGSNKAEAAARKKAMEEYRVALKNAADAEREVGVAVATNTRNNKEDLDQQAIDLAKFTEDAKKYNQQLYDAETARLDAETKAATVAKNKKILSQQQYNEINNDIRIKRLEADERFNSKEEQLENDKNKSIAESDENARKRAYDTAVRADARLLEQTKRLEDEKYITHEEAESRRQEIDQVAYERTLKLLNADLLSTTTSAEQKKDIQKAIIDLEGDHAKQVIDNKDATHRARQQDVDDLKDEADAVAELTAREAERAEAERLRRLFASPVGQFAQGLDTGTFDVIRDKSTGASLGISNMSQALNVLRQVGGAAINGLAQGVGSLVQNFILMGTVGPHAMRKLIASVLASVSAQAATMAIMELAYGIAASSGPWGVALYGNPANHFIASAFFASVAAVTGIAGHLVAGDTFKDQGVGGVAASGSGGGIGSTGTTGTGSNQAATITQNRNQAVSGAMQHTVTISLAAGLVADHLEADVQNHGKSREVILKLVNA